MFSSGFRKLLWKGCLILKGVVIHRWRATLFSFSVNSGPHGKIQSGRAFVIIYTTINNGNCTPHCVPVLCETARDYFIISLLQNIGDEEWRFREVRYLVHSNTVTALPAQSHYWLRSHGLMGWVARKAMCLGDIGRKGTCALMGQHHHFNLTSC